MQNTIKLAIATAACAYGLVGRAQFNPQPVLVTWVDIVASDGGWRDLQKALEWNTDTVQQIGFLLRQDPNQLVLTDSYFVNQDSTEQVVGYVVAIPTKVVLSIKDLR